MLPLFILAYFVYIVRIPSDAFESFHPTRGFTDNPWSEVSWFPFSIHSFFFFLLCLVSQSSPVPVLAFGTHHLSSSLPMGATGYREYVLIMLVIRTADITTLYVNFHISAWIRKEFSRDASSVGGGYGERQHVYPVKGCLVYLVRGYSQPKEKHGEK